MSMVDTLQSSIIMYLLQYNNYYKSNFYSIHFECIPAI